MVNTTQGREALGTSSYVERKASMQSVPPEAAGLQRQPGRHTRRTDRGRQAKRTHRGDCSSLCPQLETQTEFSLHTRRRRSMERQQGRWGGGRHSVAHCPADSHPRVLSAAPASQRQTDGGGGQWAQGLTALYCQRTGAWQRSGQARGRGQRTLPVHSHCIKAAPCQQVGLRGHHALCQGPGTVCVSVL